MKISFCIASLSSGGAEHQLAILCNELVTVGYKIEIVTFADLPDHYYIDNRIVRKRISPNKSSVRKFIGIFRYYAKNNSDIIFAFGQRESRILSIPLLFNRKVFIVGERNANYYKHNILQSALNALAYNRSKYIIPNSHTQAKLILKRFPRLSDKIKIITNYTDLNKYTIERYPLDKTRKICVFARYNEQKNYIRFANALIIVKKEFGCNFKVDWFGRMKSKGNSLDEGFVKLKKHIEQNDLEDIFALNDAVPNVESVIQSYQALCLPSIYEGFSNTISEAICCGRPVLAGNVSDNPTMVHDGVNGFLFNPLNERDIANKLILLLKLSDEELLNMSAQSRKIAKNIFSKHRFVSSYNEIFKNSLQ